jgi:hypothetical protein
MATNNPVSKAKIGDRVLRILNAGKDTVENRVTDRDAMLAVAQARDESIWELLSQKKSIGELDTPFDILSEKEVNATDEGNYHKAVLPTRPMALKDGRGIFLVTLKADPTTEIYPTTVSHNTMYSGQPALQMEGDMYYTPFEQELRIYGLETTNCPLIVQYVQVGEEFGNDEFFAIPPELQETVVKKAVQILSNQLSLEDPITDAKNP